MDRFATLAFVLICSFYHIYIEAQASKGRTTMLRSRRTTAIKDGAQNVPVDRNRRSFLKMLGMGLAIPGTAGVLSACGVGAPAAAVTEQATAHAQDDTHSAEAKPAKQGMTWQEMDRMHEEGVKAFPAATSGKGNQPLEPRVEDGVKVFELTCSVIDWEVTPGSKEEAWAYNGQVPGPEIRVTEGDRVRVIVKNELPESTAVHWHGVIVPNDQDGVPFITQPPITPGSTFTYEFVARNAGSHMYHAHHNSTKQVGKGLLGAFIIEQKDKSKDPEYDIDYTMIINDQLGGFTINGKGFPATEPIVAKLGQKVRIRYMNEGQVIHPMHLHGLPQLTFAKDGWNLPQPYMNDTVNVAPGERWDVLVDCTEPGVWAFHCHILSHAESEHGMFGMVTALIVEE
jgi:FtsP/CotA-like multicopper oxidase with cupredoxin domain